MEGGAHVSPYASLIRNRYPFTAGLTEFSSRRCQARVRTDDLPATFIIESLYPLDHGASLKKEPKEEHLIFCKI